MDKDQENAMVADVRQGSRQAMEALVKEFQQPVYNAAFRMLGNPDDAADVVQTTFMKVFQRFDQFDPSYRLFSWIYRIAMNETISFSKNRSKSRFRDEPLNDTEASNDPGPGDSFAADERDHDVQEALLSLSEDYRSVIVLRYFNGCNYAEMGAALGIPEKTVKSRLYSARQLLCTALQKKQVLSA